MITSLTNPKVKQAALLDQRKGRRATGLFLAEGEDILAMARQGGWSPLQVFYSHMCPFVQWARAAGAACEEASTSVLSKLSTRGNPQRVVAVFQERWGSADAVRAGVWLVLEEVRDPGNLGTIVRTVDAVGAHGVVLLGSCCDPYSREAVRASMGSVFAVPLVKMTLAQVSALSQRWTGSLIGTHLAATCDFRQPYPADTLLLMGNESAGLSDAATALCTRTVRIPMVGQAESLNLAAAAALMLYEARRQTLKIC